MTYSTLAVLYLLTSMQLIHAEDTNMIIRRVSLGECIKLALGHNFDVKIARYSSEIRRENVAVAYGAYEPSFEIAGTHFYSASPGGIDEQDRFYSGTASERDRYRAGVSAFLPTGLRLQLGGDLGASDSVTASESFEHASGGASIQLRQPVLKNFWIDSTRLSIQVSKKQLTISELALRQEIMDTITAVELSYIDLLLARERVQVQEQALALAGRIVFANQRRVAAGVLARISEKQAESQLSARQADLLGAQGLLATQEYALKQLISDDFAQWDRVKLQPTDVLTAEPIAFDLQESWRMGLTLRPDMLQAQANIERQGVVLKFLRNQLFPQLDLVGSYGQSGSGREYHHALDGIRQGDSPFYSFGAVLTIPLAGNKGARAGYRATKLEREQSLIGLKKLEQDIMVQIGVATQQAQTRLAQVASTKQARLFAEMALAGEERKLESDRTTVFVVLQLQRELTASRLAELSAVAEYNKALAQLALRQGTTLERNRLSLEIK
jgi:outer membrane protein TolC